MEMANSFATSEATEKAFDQLVLAGGRASSQRGSEGGMTTTQKRVAGAFLASLAVFVVGWLAVDVYLASTAPDAVNTVSWSMQLWVDAHPRGALVLGLAAGATFWGLICHIWLGQPTPEVWTDSQETGMLRKRVAELEVDMRIAQTEKRLADAQSGEYRKQNTALQFQLSDCLSGQRNEHGYPRLHTEN